MRITQRVVNAMVYRLYFKISSLNVLLLSNGSLKCAQCSRELVPFSEVCVLISTQSVTRYTRRFQQGYDNSSRGVVRISAALIKPDEPYCFLSNKAQGFCSPWHRGILGLSLLESAVCNRFRFAQIRPEIHSAILNLN